MRQLVTSWINKQFSLKQRHRFEINKRIVFIILLKTKRISIFDLNAFQTQSSFCPTAKSNFEAPIAQSISLIRVVVKLWSTFQFKLCWSELGQCHKKTNIRTKLQKANHQTANHRKTIDIVRWTMGTRQKFKTMDERAAYANRWTPSRSIGACSFPVRYLAKVNISFTDRQSLLVGDCIRRQRIHTWSTWALDCRRSDDVNNRSSNQWEDVRPQRRKWNEVRGPRRRNQCSRIGFYSFIYS